MGTTERTSERAAGSAGARCTAPVALVPLRTGGKSRLGPVLPTARRDALVLAMLDDVVSALRAAGIDDVRILTGDASATRAAEERGLPAIPDPPDRSEGADDGALDAPHGPIAADRSLRQAVDAALDDLPTTSVRLVVAADLPRLDPEEVRRVLADPADVAVAPTSGGGTAILRLAPGATVPACYGPGSAAAHAAAATRTGRSVALLDLPGGSLDVDDVADLLALTDEGACAPGPATTAFLAGGHG